MLQRSEQFTSSKFQKLQIRKKETRNEYHLCRCPAAVRGCGVGCDWGSSSVAADQGLRNNHLALNLWELESAAAAPIIGRGINAPVVGCLASI